MDTDEVKRLSIRMLAELDPSEIAIRIAEEVLGHNRPPGKDACIILNEMPPKIALCFLRAANRTLEYVAQQINGAVVPS